LLDEPAEGGVTRHAPLDELAGVDDARMVAVKMYPDDAEGFAANPAAQMYCQLAAESGALASRFGFEHAGRKWNSWATNALMVPSSWAS
jgi:hypothetical protein